MLIWEVWSGTNLAEIPNLSHLLTPILFAIPLQLLALNTAKLLEHDVDKPRNT